MKPWLILVVYVNKEYDSRTEQISVSENSILAVVSAASVGIIGHSEQVPISVTCGVNGFGPVRSFQIVSQSIKSVRNFMVFYYETFPSIQLTSGQQSDGYCTSR